MKAASHLAWIWLVAAGPALCGAAEETNRYWALFADGTEVADSDVKDWHDRRKRVTIGGRWLFDPGKPVRLLCETTRRPGGSGPRVFLANGDVLPGRVVAFLPAEPAANLPDRLAVAVAPPLVAGDQHSWDREKQPEPLAYVRATSVARILLARGRAQPHEGGAVVFADGGRRAVSAVRWTPTGLKALGEEGIVSGSFKELAEIHLPKTDVAEAVLADSAVPWPDAGRRIGRMVTVEEAVLTYRVAMRKSEKRKYHGRYDTYHAIQPLWALTPIQVPEGSICLRSYRQADEVPLSLLAGRTLEEKSFTGFPWPWRRNRNVRGEVLRCGSYYADLGIGTHSFSQVAFDLPAGARTFSCIVGLDHAVGTGGCARCRIRRDSPSGKELWRGHKLIGSKQPARVGPLDVRKARRLVLVSEFAHDDRPTGADPGDVRDEVNWLLPMVTVDPASLAMTRKRLDLCFPAWQAWSIAAKNLARLKLSAARLSRRPWQIGVDIDEKGLNLTRKVRPSLLAAVVEIAAARGEQNSGQTLDLLVDGQRLKGLYDDGRPVVTRRRGPGDPVSQRWNLMPLLGKDVTLTVTVRRDPDAKDGRCLVSPGLAIHPLIAGLRAGGKVLAPDVPLSQGDCAQAIWHPADKGKRPTRTEPPKPADETVHGLKLPNSYRISAGMNLTYKLQPSFRRFVAVLGTENRYHRGPFTVWLDGKEVYRSGSAIGAGQLEQVAVDIPAGSKTLELVAYRKGRERKKDIGHNMSTGVWAQAGFVRQ